MNDFNKITTRYGLIMLALALVGISTIIVLFGFLKSGIFWPAIIPVIAAVVYGCVVFFKTYKPSDKY